MKQSCLAAG